MRKFRIEFFTLLLLIPFAANAQNYLQDLRGKSSSTIANAAHGTRLDSSFFVARIGTNFRDVTRAILERGYSADDFASLAAAINQAESDTAMVIVAENHKTISATDTLHRTASLVVYKGGLINISTGINFLIQGHFYAGRYKVFEGSGTVTFDEGSVDQIYPEWWGGVPDSTTASLTSFQKILTAANGAMIGLTNRGKWSFSDSFLISKPVAIVGTSVRRSDQNSPIVHYGTTILNTNTSGGSTIVSNTNGLRLENLTLFGNRQNGHGLLTYRSPATTTMGDWRVSDIYSESNGGDGFRFSGADGTTLIRLNAQFNGGWGLHLTGPTTAGAVGIANTVLGGRSRRNSDGGALVRNRHGVFINYEAVSDTLAAGNAGMMVQGLPGTNDRTYGNTFIGTDVEQNIPALASPSYPISNWRLQDVSATTLIGNFMGVKYAESTTYTVDSTATGVIKDTALLSNTTNYYVGWYVENTTRSSGNVRVTAYNATNKVLTLASAIAGQTAGDVYAIRKYPNRWMTMDSVYSSVFINNHFTPTDITPDSGIVVGRAGGASTFANMLFIGDQLNMNPDTSIIETTGGTANWGEINVSQGRTGGELWINANRGIELKSSAGHIDVQPDSGNNVYFFQRTPDNENSNLRIYYDANISTAATSRKYIYFVRSSTVNNAITLENSDDSTRVVFGGPIELSGNDSTERFMDVLASNRAPTRVVSNNRVRLYSFQDKLWSKQDNGDTLNVTPYNGATTWNPGNLTAGSTDSTTVTVTNAVAGDVVSVGLSSITSANANLQLWGHVISAGSVRVFIRNNSGGTYDTPSGTVKVRVWK